MGPACCPSYWNGAATYYRGILRALAPLGHDITFFEPDAFDRQSHRDIDPPPWCRVVVYQATEAGVRDVLAQAARADVVIKASGVGVFDDALLDGMITHAAPDALRVFWDVDAPATLAEIAGEAGPHAAPRSAPSRPCADLWRRRPGRVGLSRLRRSRLRAGLQRPRPQHASSGAAGAPLRRRSDLPGQSPARSRAAGRGFFPRRRGAASRSNVSCSAAPAGTTKPARPMS